MFKIKHRESTMLFVYNVNNVYLQINNMQNSCADLKKNVTLKHFQIVFGFYVISVFHNKKTHT